MTSKQILQLYKNAIRITSTGSTWNRVKKAWLAVPAKKRLMSFDTETTGVTWGVPSYYHTAQKDVKCNNPTAFGVSLGLDLDGKVILVWADRRFSRDLYLEVIDLLLSRGTKVAHNARYDLRVLDSEGQKVSKTVDCTYTMSRIYWDRRQKHSLQSIAEVLCPELSDWEVPVNKEFTRLKGKYTRNGYPKDYVNYSFIKDKLICPYSMMDSFMTLMTYKHLWPCIRKDYLEVYEREKKVFHIINKIEAAGMAFDSEKAKKKATSLQKKAHRLHLELDDLASGGFNPNSPSQVLDTLKLLGVTSGELTTRGKITTDAPTLNKVLATTEKKKVRDFITMLLDYRACTKIINTYLLPLTERAELNNGIVLCSINPADSRTGRMACVTTDTELVTTEGVKPIKDIKIGDYVKTHKSRYRRVLEKWNNGIRPVFDIILCNGNKLTCTISHRLLSYNGKWITIKEILNEYIKNVAEEKEEHKCVPDVIQREKLLYYPGDSKNPEDILPQHSLCCKESPPGSRIPGSKKDTQIELKDGREKSSLRKTRRAVPQLEGRVRRRIWLSDITLQRQETFCSQTCYDETSRFEEPAEDVGCPSYRQQSEEQQYRESCSLFNKRSSGNTLLAGEGQSIITIKKINFARRSEVYDLTIEEDESYLTAGIFSHNSREPNLQNIPEPVVRHSGSRNPVRECFVPRKGFHNYYFDFSQMEMYIFGIYACDERIVEGYDNGEDVHRIMAEIIYGKNCSDHQRNITKNINFGVIYGMGIRAMALLYKMSESEARDFMNTYYETFPRIRTFQQECEDELQEYGYLSDLFGRRYHVPVQQAYKGVNAIVQGSCAQIFKIALINLARYLGYNNVYSSKIILPLHDEFQIESMVHVEPREEKVFCRNIIDCMTSIPQLAKRGFKLRVSVKKTDTNWAEKEEMRI